MPKWENRIVAEGEEPPEQLMANPRNWRIHPVGQQDTMSNVLSEIGWIQRVIVNRTTGNVIDGHMRVAIAIAEEEPTVPVTYVELTEDEEAVALATFDPITSMAVPDPEQFDRLLADITGDDSAVNRALADIASGADVTPSRTADGPAPSFSRTIEINVESETYFRWQARRSEFDSDDEFVTYLLDHRRD
jgi:ParB-like chromosome segregation protein Spo0J